MTKNITSSLILLMSFVIGGGLGYVHSRPDGLNRQLLITLESSVPAETQLFYDTGKGFNENESISKIVYHANVPVSLHFDLSGSNIRGLRFDPSRAPARMIIHEIILKYQGEKPFALPLDSVTAVNDIKSIRYNGNKLTVETTENAQDPILQLNKIDPAPKTSTMRTILHIITGAFVALSLAFFIVWLYRSSVPYGADLKSVS